MAQYDDSAATYIDWSVTDTPYSVVEWYVFLRTLGSVEGLDVLDLACGDGRLSRVLLARGARSVVGTDVSQEMIDRARMPGAAPSAVDDDPSLRFQVVDARDEAFVLASPADVVTAMYLFHYASSVDELGRMCRFIARNLRPGGRFVTYTIDPDFVVEEQDPRMPTVCGFRYGTVAPPNYTLEIGDLEVDIWQWSRADHERCLADAGLIDVEWHPLELPDERAELEPVIGFYVDHPSCTVLSARRGPDGDAPDS